MMQFARLSYQRHRAGYYRAPVEPSDDPNPRRARRLEAADLQRHRRTARAQRTQEDAAWRILKAEHEAVMAARLRHQGSEYPIMRAEDVHWRALRQQRTVTLQQRSAENTQWRAARQRLRAALADAPIPTHWRAILMVTDNCTRQCFELPLFATGSRVSAEEVLAALQTLLPASIQFIISDQGTHFTANIFQRWVHSTAFIHVPIARHRPESNGIAERCVRTLKEWLARYAWADDAELAALLRAFVHDYNDRPHQGLGMPGLSPNEFARRIWLI